MFLKRILFSTFAVSLGLIGQCIAASNAYADNYQSPYRIEFTVPAGELLAPNNVFPRSDKRQESATRFENWYSDGTRKAFGPWGPVARKYPVIDGYDSMSTDWKRQRLIAVASEMIGLPYQHHHIPDWEPPADWPWKQVAYGRNSKGLDCSDFTSWIYNYGLGIKLNTGIKEQALANSVSLKEGDNSLLIQKLYDDGSYESLVKKLRAGDLLYIKHKGSNVISHVIMWLGKHGRSPDGTPLVIDCTGPEHTDCNGNQIPIGVQIRPFGRSSWYYKSFDHANRIFATE